MSKKGCSCSFGCETLRCSCRSNAAKCDTNCKCIETEIGCSNLAYCSCRTGCATKRCSCNKSSINCVPDKCRCINCINVNHKSINDKNLSKQSSEMSDFS